MKKIVKYVFVLAILFLISCDKDTRTKDELIGIWISNDFSETLDFVDYATFTNDYAGLHHSFSYDIFGDSIEVEYYGPNMILVLPSTHHFELNGNSLRIDFTNGCYGFKSKINVYIKQK
jgi:hypothetical protein